MAAKIDQKAYLQKYLSGPSGHKKKKKKKVSKGEGFRIIDDDLDLSKLRPLDGDELDILGEGEDAPQIAGIIDERPEDVRKMEQFKTTSKWRVINEDDGFNSKLQIQEVKKDIKEAEKENELVFGKMYSDSEDEEQKNSPPTKQQPNETQVKPGPTKKPLTHSDSDFSPPRKTKEGKPATSSSNNYDFDLSLSPPRKQVESKSNTKQDNCDLSPPKKQEKRKVDAKSKEKGRDSDSDLSPPRKHDKRKVDSKSKNNSRGFDSDLSPPRMNDKSKERARKPSRWGDFKEEEKKYEKSLKSSHVLYQRSSRSPESKSGRDKRKKASQSKANDSDLSPPRKSNKNSNRNYDSDLSPPRKPTRQNKSPHSPERRNSKHNNRNRYDERYTANKGDKYVGNKYSDRSGNQFRSSKEQISDRRRQDSSDRSPDRNDTNRVNNKRKFNKSSDSPPPSNKKMEKTLDGKQAGLQNAVQMKQENDAFRRREEEAFSKMTDEISGRNARVVSRRGKRETSEEKSKQKEKAEKQKELDEKYKKWGKGLKQMEDQDRRVQEFMHEASKPLARHKGDRDLEDRLKDVEREGDPMLQYIQAKKRDRGDLGPEKPSYKGSFPPNRFNIRPGYRWDGVDRSNGYEKKYFDQQSKRKAEAEEAYKWSTEDL